MTDNVQIVRNIYAGFAAGDVPAVLGAFAPEIEWNEAEGHPYADGNPYRGPQAVLEGVFARLVGEWDGFAVDPGEYLDAGDTVVVLGRYKGTFKATGKPQDVQMAHVWRLADGKVTGFQQYADTRQIAAVCGL